MTLINLFILIVLTVLTVLLSYLFLLLYRLDHDHKQPTEPLDLSPFIEPVIKEIPVKWVDNKKGQLLKVTRRKEQEKETETFFIFSSNFTKHDNDKVQDQFTYSELNAYNKAFTKKLDFRL